MRLLNVYSLKLKTFHRLKPHYAVASHRWIDGAETSFQDVEAGSNQDTAGYVKIQRFAAFVRDHVQDVEWLWIDTCCINKQDSQELQEAITMMYRWYGGAAVCLAYLHDVPVPHGGRKIQESEEFHRSVWFTRGWTLQELLAPHLVVFLAQEWQVLGHTIHDIDIEIPLVAMGPRLNRAIAHITDIPEEIITEPERSEGLRLDQRLRWIDSRTTTRPEDMSYSLLGIFKVAMPLIYGEGQRAARRRLIRAIQERDEDPLDDSEAESAASYDDWRPRTLDKAMYLRTLEGEGKALGAGDTSSPDRAYTAGNEYISQGKLPEAENSYLRALKGFENAAGPRPTSMLDTMNNLGIVYQYQGKLAEAEKMYLQALRGKERTWGLEHKSTLSTIEALGKLYKSQGKLAEAEKMYLQALRGKEQALGPDHESTLKMVNNLGIVYQYQGKLAEAEKMFLQALRGKERALGSDHKSTLRTVNNLGVFYAECGKLTEAEEMYQRVLKYYDSLPATIQAHNDSLGSTILKKCESSLAANGQGSNQSSASRLSSDMSKLTHRLFKPLHLFRKR